MCGISGIVAFNNQGKLYFSNLLDSVKSLHQRGPDNSSSFIDDNVGLGHARLSIIDTSARGNQPLTDASGRYKIVFNGEFYNYKQYKEELINKGYVFHSDSDTEVFLNLFIEYGKKAFELFNGFFALAIYDTFTGKVVLARDRMGIKPLYLYQDDDKVIFSSEMKGIFAFQIPKEIDQISLYNYLQLNYIPGSRTILKNVIKVTPGTIVEIEHNNINTSTFYSIPYNNTKMENCVLSYEQAQEKLRKLMSQSVERRLVSDVPLGAFLSGGIDSSVIVAEASKYKKDLHTFSIGYSDEPYFDETAYAQIVANRFKTNHTVFSLSNKDLFEHLYDVLDYIDEPFADSSALAVYILSKKVREHIKVVLSGDGADEMFTGYNKHRAEYKVRNGDLMNQVAKYGLPLWNILPQSRNSKMGNFIRQLNRFGNGLLLSDQERYWQWCSITNENKANCLLKTKANKEEYATYKHELLKKIKDHSMNGLLYADMHIVLQNDMLTKVDAMSMANGLEIRVPFLDHTMVDFAFSIPSEYKINGQMTKRILKDAYRNILPNELYQRPKHGFEVPLLNYLRTELKTLICTDLLSEDFIKTQGVFNYKPIKQLKEKLFSHNPGDVHAQIWALVVFQYWWKKYIQ